MRYPLHEMLFNSLQFAVFFLVVYSCYTLLNHKWQNRLLLVASYAFYGAWAWRFLSLLILSTTVDYFWALGIQGTENQRRRKFFLCCSLVGNFTILGFFKYFHFFANNLQVLLSLFGMRVSVPALHIVLPIGISFYTFQIVGYVVDVYRREVKATRNFLDFALFVSFFPQLIAGPIERAQHLLSQVLAPREMTRKKFYEGCYLIFWGLFQKVCIADNLAGIVDPIFAAGPPYHGAEVLLAIYAFAFQILCDFAGYSDMARGLGKCMGFDLVVNFNAPYFSTNPREFWQRWHISLSTWLRDYLYKPLGGNRKGAVRTYCNLAITMLLGGLWHGAKWTFVVWGAYQGLLLIIYRVVGAGQEKDHVRDPGIAGTLLFVLQIILFFHLVCVGWLFFRAGSLVQALEMLQSIFGGFHLILAPSFLDHAQQFVFFAGLLVMMHLFQHFKNDQLAMLRVNTLIRAVFYVTCYFLLVVAGSWNAKEFIYFQF